MENKKNTRGNGRVYPHGGSWWIDISFGGRRRRESIAPLALGAKGKKLAGAVLTKRLLEIRENRFFDVKRDCRITFPELADKYLTWAKDNHHAYSKSDIYFVQRLKAYFGDMLIADISKEDIARYKKHRKGDGVSNSTINHELTTLRLMFNLAINFWEHPDDKQSYLFEGRNPAEKFDKLPEESRDRYLTKGDLVKLVDHLLEKIKCVKSGRDRKGFRGLLDFILIAVTAGLRKGEIKALSYGSKDIHLSDTDLMDNYIYLPGARTKNGKPRIVYLNRISKAILSRPFDFNYEPRHLWEEVREHTGLVDVTIHDLRRTFSTYLEGLGIGAFTVAALMGHQVPGFGRDGNICTA